MSHAVVLVIGEDLDGQLAPYDENKEVEPYKDYTTLDPEHWPVSFLAKEYPDADMTDAATVARLYNGHWGEGESTKYEVDEKGLFEWSTYNPESKWDYWRVGGRWAGSLLLTAPDPCRRPELSWEWQDAPADQRARLLDGRHVSQALAGEIDWQGMRLERLAAIDKRWDGYEKVLVEQGPEAAAREAWWTFGLEKDEVALGREEHLAKLAPLHPLYWVQALVAEGVWREKGRMGWFGASTDGPDERDDWSEWFSSFMARVPENVTLSIVDYHI